MQKNKNYRKRLISLLTISLHTKQLPSKMHLAFTSIEKLVTVILLWNLLLTQLDDIGRGKGRMEKNARTLDLA